MLVSHKPSPARSSTGSVATSSRPGGSSSRPAKAAIVSVASSSGAQPSASSTTPAVASGSASESIPEVRIGGLPAHRDSIIAAIRANPGKIYRTRDDLVQVLWHQSASQGPPKIY